VTRKHVLILNGNPDPGADRLTHALARAYHEGAEEAGHIVRHINIGGVEFPLLRSARDFETEPAEKAIIEAQGAFLSADHIVIVYPLWLGGPPALLKAYMEQLARLKGRSSRVIITMGMPALIYRLMYGAHGVKAFNRSILNLAGIKPVATTLFGGRQIQPPQSAKTIQTIRDMGRRLA
jgi:putative NADPH-quinone reductase